MRTSSPSRSPQWQGAEPLLPGTSAHIVAAHLAEALRRGITTIRDVGSYGDVVVEARQAMRLGAFRGPRLLTCGRIVSATSPGGRFFDGMYREADGPDDIRRAVREQLRHGADFVKVMTTGARSVELEDPDPAQLTGTEVATLVEEAHRLGYRVAAHAEGLPGTEIAIETGIDTIEHGMYLNQRPDLLERMALQEQVLVPTLSCFYGVAGIDEQGDDAPPTWSPLLVELAEYNLEQADRTLSAARAAGVRIALGHDWNPFYNSAIELERMVHHGMPAMECARRCDGHRRGGAGAWARARNGRAGPDRRPAGARRRPAGRPGPAAPARADLARAPARRAGRRRRARAAVARLGTSALNALEQRVCEHIAGREDELVALLQRLIGFDTVAADIGASAGEVAALQAYLGRAAARPRRGRDARRSPTPALWPGIRSSPTASRSRDGRSSLRGSPARAAAGRCC